MCEVFGFGGDSRRDRFGWLPLESRARPGFGFLCDSSKVSAVALSTAPISHLLLLEGLYPRFQSRHVLLVLLVLLLTL